MGIMCWLNVLFAADTDDLFEVVCELDDVAHMWRPLGTALRLRPSTLARIKADHQQDSRSCLSEMVTEWLNQSYNTERFGLPSWKMLVEAVAHRNGGNNNALAIHIATKYKGQCERDVYTSVHTHSDQYNATFGAL